MLWGCSGEALAVGSGSGLFPSEEPGVYWGADGSNQAEGEGWSVLAGVLSISNDCSGPGVCLKNRCFIVTGRAIITSKIMAIIKTC